MVEGPVTTVPWRGPSFGSQLVKKGCPCRHDEQLRGGVPGFAEAQEELAGSAEQGPLLIAWALGLLGLRLPCPGQLARTKPGLLHQRSQD